MGYTSDVTVAICMYTLSVVLLLFMFMGHNINHLDICPNFAGTLMGITNGLANIASMLAPQFIGFVITDYVSIVKLITIICHVILLKSLRNCDLKESIVALCRC